jgi:hypothetical protein
VNKFFENSMELSMVSSEKDMLIITNLTNFLNELGCILSSRQMLILPSLTIAMKTWYTYERISS